VSDPIGVVESAYAREGETEVQWLGRVAAKIRTNLADPAGPFLAWSYRIRPSGWIDLDSVVEEPTGLAARAFPFETSDEGQAGLTQFHRTAGLNSALRLAKQASYWLPYFDRLAFSHGFRDMVSLNSVDAAGGGCQVIMLTKDVVRLHSSTFAQWARISVHVGAGLRLQRKLGKAEIPPETTASADAILTPGGRVEHASGTATAKTAREALREGVQSMERARGPLRRRDPREAVEVWRGLVSGLWSLVDHFDTDGRRYLIAHRNEPTTPDPRALTERERQIVAYADLGQPNKLIAYQLGLSPSTVAVHLARAREKLRRIAGEASSPKSK
jgi:Bacterial regulatory proteins, luxR family